MKGYKLGNRGTCILRSFSSGDIGQISMTYGNQPYTILKDVDAEIRFKDNNTESSSRTVELVYNVDYLDSIKLSNINITDKILNLIYSKKEEVFSHFIEKRQSDENKKIYLSNSAEKYQVFVYGEDEQLETAFGTLSTNVIDVKKANGMYLVVYSCLANKGYALTRPTNTYMSLDLQVEGNDNKDKKVIYWIHLHKCALKTNQNLSFNNGVNTVDLEFKILHSDKDYITIVD